ncbi:hypothetical protein K456DRAFT_373975 [Colletotrichum gloeosporioides 23]|nr:hypothetical protein K456DRAFT_373975 [Colletotrichum gloeosporioides 23]
MDAICGLQTLCAAQPLAFQKVLHAASELPICPEALAHAITYSQIGHRLADPWSLQSTRPLPQQDSPASNAIEPPSEKQNPVPSTKLRHLTRRPRNANPRQPFGKFWHLLSTLHQWYQALAKLLYRCWHPRHSQITPLQTSAKRSMGTFPAATCECQRPEESLPQDTKTPASMTKTIQRWAVPPYDPFLLAGCTLPPSVTCRLSLLQQ